MSLQTGLYVFTAIISIVIGVVLVHISKLSHQTQAKEKRKMLKESLGDYDHADESVQESVYEEISEFVDMEKDCQEISRKVLDIFDKELTKKTEQTTLETKKKYENLIADKDKDNKVAWQKFKKVNRDKKTTEAVMKSLSAGLVVVDKSGKVIMLNPAAEKLLDVEQKDKIGKSVLEGLKKEQLASFAKDDPNKEDREIELVSKEDETKKILRASSAVIENENGETVGMVSVLSDITKQKELDAMKANFVSNITHELRTPLVATQKSITLLLTKSAGNITNAQEHFLTVSDRNLKRLSLLIDDLLDLSKLEAGKMELRLVPSSIADVIEETVENLGTWAKTKSIDIKKNFRKDMPKVNIDPDRLNQVLNNLIGNSIKYTPEEGKLIVSAAIIQNQLELSVEDTGIGIPKEDLGKVFDKFYQTGERSMADISGTGIGLAIAKEIVELHNGKIWVESDGAKGAKFIFTIPI